MRNIVEDPDGTLWLLSRGLYRLRQDQLDHFGASEGLTGENLSDWAEDALGHVWLSSYAGLFRVSRDELASAPGGSLLRTARRFGPPDGLRSAKTVNPGAPTLQIDRRGRLWLASFAGLGLLDLGAATELREPAQLRIDRVTAAGREWMQPESVHLPLGERDVELPFSIPPRGSFHSVRFRHRVLPLQPDWSASHGQRALSLPRLPPGRYTVEVQALDGSKRLPEARVELVVPARWWEARTGRGLFLLAVLAVLLLLFQSLLRWRMRWLQQRSDQLSREVEARTRELAAANEQLTRLARTDVLTGVNNRRGFEEAMEASWKALLKPASAPMCLLLVDIDHFKSYNDHYGHPAGDAALSAVAALMQTQLRDGDMLARVGGEEFAILIRGDVQAALALTARIRTALQQRGLPHAGIGADRQLTLSFGISEQGRTRFASVAGWIAAADQALYRAKQAGRDCVQLADDGGSAATTGEGRPAPGA